MQKKYRRATLVNPKKRMSDEQIKAIHEGSLAILNDPGVTCFNEHAADLYGRAGCKVSRADEGMDAWNVKITPQVIQDTLTNIPERVVLGARNPDNKLLLDAQVPNVYFGTGSETNIFLKTELKEYVCKDDASETMLHPEFIKERGSLKNLCTSAKLCNSLENVDFFIRNVNIQDEDITLANKDVNVFMAALMYMTKHVQAGVVDLSQLDNILKIAEIIAGGERAFKENPLVSFITCVIKSPLQMVEDTTEKLIAIAQRGMPVVISSSPQGGSTAPIQEEGIVSLINAEILAGIAMAQIVNPGTPVLYGAVPVRARLDTLHDLYGAPEFIHYNADCIQMARHYGVPCYSSAGVGDAKVPGMQATIEKVFAQLEVAAAGAQYIHYAFGLLDKTNVFCPLQAVLDDAHVGKIRHILRQPVFNENDVADAAEQIKHTLASSTKLFARYIRKARRKGLVTAPYAFESESDKDEVLIKAHHRLEEIFAGEDEKLDQAIVDKIYDKIPGLLPKERFEL